MMYPIWYEIYVSTLQPYINWYSIYILNDDKEFWPVTAQCMYLLSMPIFTATDTNTKVATCDHGAQSSIAAATLDL
jgi:hypothetical protein